jgi:hypothetical protein
MIYGLLIMFMMIRQPKGIMGFLAEFGLVDRPDSQGGGGES